MVAPEDFMGISHEHLAQEHVKLLNHHEDLKQKWHEAVETIKRDDIKIAELQSSINKLENEADELADELDRQKGVSVGFMSKIVLQAKLNKALLEALSAYEALSHLKE